MSAYAPWSRAIREFAYGKSSIPTPFDKRWRGCILTMPLADSAHQQPVIMQEIAVIRTIFSYGRVSRVLRMHGKRSSLLTNH